MKVDQQGPAASVIRRTRHDPDVDHEAGVASTSLPDPGSGGSRAGEVVMTMASDAEVTFRDVQVRARRLITWAAEESAYLRSHDVGTFTRADRSGRDFFADEGLYLLLPRLRRDAATLRLHCGPGPLWSGTKDLVDQAARDVQDYYQLWTRLKEEVG